MRQECVAKDNRDPYQRDYARIIHSAAFRRLQSKTQVLGIGDSDFYRTRLTHSLEVSQIGESIALQLKRDHNGSYYAEILPDPILIRTICLAHDLGHPPFGHGGEVALNRCMLNYGGFEGNGQTLRIMSHLEPYHKCLGMNLTRRTLLGVLKYPAPYSLVVDSNVYPEVDRPIRSVFKAEPFKPPKCYLDTECGLVDWLSEEINPLDWNRVSTEFEKKEAGKHWKTKHKTLDTSIMEIADDIAYGVHDLEDAIGLKLIDETAFRKDASEANLQPFCKWLDGLVYDDLIKSLFSTETYERKNAIGKLVGFCVQHTKLETSNPFCFIEPIFAFRAVLADDARQVLNILKDLVVNRVIRSATVQQLEFKGQKIVTELFEAFATDPERLLPKGDAQRWENAGGKVDKVVKQHRVICDYIAGMTDEYATKRYQQLFSPRIGSVFDRL
jgi:dGTPase